MNYSGITEAIAGTSRDIEVFTVRTGEDREFVSEETEGGGDSGGGLGAVAIAGVVAAVLVAVGVGFFVRRR